MTYEVTVAIPTFRRPDGIVRAVNSVAPQVAALNSDPTFGVAARILVIDNDPEASGAATVADLAVDYVHEPEPGIAAVRNRAIDESAQSDAIVFLDDDEVATETWLRTLISIHRESGADAVAGRVKTEFPADVDPWVRESGAFIRPSRIDGQRMSEAATNNLLLSLKSLHRLRLRFDEAFGLTGGSDSLFTRQLVSRGGVIIWAQEALVVELEDPQRFQPAWVRMRTFRFGNTATRVDIAMAKSAPGRVRARFLRLVRGLARVGGGGSRALWGLASRSLTHRARGERTMSRGAGMVAGVFGYTFSEYGRRRKRMGMTT